MKELKDMNVLELKGILYDLDLQIRQIQNYAQTNVVPLLNQLIKEEKTKQVNIQNSKVINSPIIVETKKEVDE